MAYLVGGLDAYAQRPARTGTPQPRPFNIAAPVVAEVATEANKPTLPRRRHRKAVPELGRRYEYLEPEAAAETAQPATAAPSDRGSQPMGYAGTTPTRNAKPAGLTTLAGSTFADGTLTPMTPSTWYTNFIDDEPTDA